MSDSQPAVPGVIGVVGAGAMGRGIVQIALVAGYRVVLADARVGACEEAADSVLTMLEKLVAKGRLCQEQLNQAREHLGITRLDDLTPFGHCDVVIEAIVEQVEAKQALFTELEKVVADDCILATNTSSLSVTEIASACSRPQRVAGFHFFNPVPLMKVVEVIRGQTTDDGVIDTLCRLAEAFGHQPAPVADMPGFLVNHAGRGYGTEALRILAEGVADIETLDRILRDQCGFRMGPFELFDLTGLDISHTVTESIYHQFYEDPRYRPSPITAQRMKAGLLGRKSGRGFYHYEGGVKQTTAEPPAPVAESVPVWVSPAEAEGGAQLRRLLEKGAARLELGDKPSATALCLVTPLGRDATEEALAQGLDPVRTVAVDTLMGLDRRRIAMLTPVTGPRYRDLAWGLMAEDGTPVSIIQDSPGFVSQRVLAAIINIACEIAQLKIASPADIDTAVRLGLGYPRGPLAWSDELEPKRILSLLERLHARYGDPRYRPSLWLQRRAELLESTTTVATPVQ